MNFAQSWEINEFVYDIGLVSSSRAGYENGWATIFFKETQVMLWNINIGESGKALLTINHNRRIWNNFFKESYISQDCQFALSR